MAEEPATIDHVGFLADVDDMPGFLLRDDSPTVLAHYSCAFCGVGDSGRATTESLTATAQAGPETGIGLLQVEIDGRKVECAGWFSGEGRFEVEADEVIAAPGTTMVASLEIAGQTRIVVATEVETRVLDDGASQTFSVSSPMTSTAKTTVTDKQPTSGCVKLRLSLGQQRGAFPIHVGPSDLDLVTGRRRSMTYDDAIARFADLLLAHRPPHGRTLFYGCGQIDYFTVFAAQEVLRLLGVRNLTGNAEHCLNAGAVHNEMLTGQEGPFLTIDQALDGPGRFFVLNGWNGLITHPPAFQRILKRGDLDAYLVEVATTESAQALTQKLGPERVLYLRAGSDPHLALAVAHEILDRHSESVDRRFTDHYADAGSLTRFRALAMSDRFAPDRVAARIAPEPAYQERLVKGIRDIAARLARPDLVPINIPSVGLSQSKGAVAHCLWGDVLALVGKYGLLPDGSPAGGTLRLPGQINAQSEVQGLSRRIFMGRIRMDEQGAVEAARRMGLPDDAYETALHDTGRPALDYSDGAEVPELIVCFGTQFESNMMERQRWIRKLEAKETTLVVVDPIPDPFTLERARLVIPPPPHGATAKLYQNGEWRMTLSTPRKRAPEQTRSDATILYDTMAEVSRKVRLDTAVAAAHPDLAALATSGYLRRRFESPEQGGELVRVGGEVSRPQLWDRVIDYFSAGSGPLYCRPDHADGSPIAWNEVLERGSIVYGGVGTTRYRLDYDDPEHVPFADIYRRPRTFTFFVPTEDDLRLPEGTIFNSGRSTMSDDRQRIRFATATFNSGKATPLTGMPDENPMYVSPSLAARHELATGDLALITNVETGDSLVLPVVVSERVKGDSVYVSFHKSRAELDHGRYLNVLTSHTGRCPYTAQSNFKATHVSIERLETDRRAVAKERS